MLNLFQQWLRFFPLRFLPRRNQRLRLRSRSSSTRRPAVAVEQRVLLSATLPDVLAAFNSGATAQHDQAASAAQKVFGTNLPGIVETVNNAFDLSGKLQQAFGIQVDTQSTGSQVRSALVDAGFVVEWPANDSQWLTQDANGDYLRVSRADSWTGTSASFSFDDQEVPYFAGIRGGVDGSATVQADPISLSLKMGIDLVGGQPAFYVADTSNLNVQGLHGSGQITGDFGKEYLLHLHADGTLSANLSGKLTVPDTDGTADHKLHFAATTLDGAVSGQVNGSAQFTAALTTDIPFLTGLQANATWNVTFDSTGGHLPAAPQFTFPSAADVQQSIVNGFFSAKNGLLLPDGPGGDITDLLQTNLSFLNTSIGEKLGVAGKLGQLFSAVSDTTAALADWGITLPTFDASFLTQIINGQKKDLIKFNKSDTFLNWSESTSYPVFAVAVGPFVADAEISPWINVHGDYSVGLGVDTTGVYLDPSTHISIAGAVGADLTSTLSLAGLTFLGSASLSAGLGVGAHAGLYLTDPDPSDGNRIYFDEIFRPGESVVSDVLDIMRLDVGLDLVAHVSSEIELPWPMPTYTLFDETYTLGSMSASATSPAITTSKRQWAYPGQTKVAPITPLTNLDGTKTLRLNGTVNPNLVTLEKMTDGKVKVVWSGYADSTWDNVTKVIFNGGASNDRLAIRESSTPFDVPILANGNGGNDVLTGGSANDTLNGGAGNDNLNGAGGNDLIHGNDNDDQLTGGDGADTLWGDAHEDRLFGSAGIDVLHGGTENDFLDGGADADKLYGEAGLDILHGGLANDYLDGGTEADLLYGEDQNDTLYGQAGNDTLDGGTGNDTVDGGDDDDQLFGQLGNDLLRGQAGSDHLIGGPDTVAAGVADNDTLQGSFGNDDLEGGTGIDSLYGDDGDDVLRGGADNDKLYGGRDNDRLNGEAGLDSLYGGAGNDLIELDLSTSAGTDTDVFSGGVDQDTVAAVGSDHVILGPDGKSILVPNDDVLSLSRISATVYEATSNDPVTNAILGNLRFTTVTDPATKQSDVERVGLYGLGGNDSLKAIVTGAYPVSRDLVLDGGDGNDTLAGGRGRDLLLGGPGNDSLDGGANDDELHGGSGNDTLRGNDGTDRLYGDAGNDTLDGGDGSDVQYGGPGADSLSAGSGNFGDIMYGDDETDGNADSGPHPWDPSLGAGSADTIVGGLGADIIFGGGGPDVLSGSGLNDLIMGGAGNDTLRGGQGSDYLFGGDDDDVIYAFTDDVQAVEAFNAMDWEAERARLEDERTAVENVFWTVDAEIDAIDVLDNVNNNAITQITSDGQQALVGLLNSAKAMLAQLKSDGTPDDQQSRQITLWTTRVKVYDGMDGRTEPDPANAAIDLLHLQNLASLQGRLEYLLPYALTLDNSRKFYDGLIDNLPSEYQNISTDLMAGEQGNDRLYGTIYADRYLGGGDDDSLYASGGNDLLIGGDGAGDEFIVQGTAAADDLQFVAQLDPATGNYPVRYKVNGVEIGRLDEIDVEVAAMDGLGGDDSFTVNFGTQAVRNIHIIGGAGNDFLDARGAGQVVVLPDDPTTHADDDPATRTFQAKATLEGGIGDDTLFGGLSDDELAGDAGLDWLYGGQGNDSLQGGDDRDRLFGDDGNAEAGHDSEYRVNVQAAGDQQTFPQSQSIAVDAAGDYVIVWASPDQNGTNDVYARRFSRNGVPQGSEVRVNVYTTSIQVCPAVAMDAAGDFVVSWMSFSQDGSGYGVYARRYNAAGEAQPNEFRVNSYTTSNQLYPTVAMDAAGDFVVSWTSVGQDGSAAGIYAQRYNTAGAKLGGEFRVNSHTALEQSVSSVAMDASGDFVVSWMSDGQDGSGYGVYARRYTAAGVAQGAEFRVNAYTADDQRFATVAMDAAGDFVVSWSSAGQDGSERGVYARRYNAAGVPQGNEFRVNTRTAGDQWFSRVALDSLGNFIVSWTDDSQDGSNWGVYGQRYNASGLAQGGEFQVNTYMTGLQYGSSAAFDADGDYVIAWTSQVQDGSGYGVYARRYARTEFRANTYTAGNQSQPRVAADANGDYVVAWTSLGQDGSGYGVYAQRYNAAGVAQGNEFQVNSYTPGNQWQPAVAMDADGDFVITWSSFGQDGSEYGVYAQRYNAAGLAQGGEFRVNSYTAQNQLYSTVAMDSQGDFAVTWTSAGQDGSGAGVYAQRYNAAGALQGSEFRVNTNVSLDQVWSTLAMNAVGDFVVTWMCQTGGGWDVFAQRYTAAGGLQGGEFQVNSATSTKQLYPNLAMDAGGDFVVSWLTYDQNDNRIGASAKRYNAAGAPQGSEIPVDSNTTDIAMDAAGNFVVVWQSNHQDGSQWGVYAQKYNAVGSPQGGEFRVNSYTTNDQKAASLAVDAAGDFIVAWSSQGQDGSGDGVYAKRFSAAFAGNNDPLGDDSLYGGSGDDFLFGEAGDDSLWGGTGNDAIAGNQGNDSAWGEAGQDVISGDAGNDAVWGGNGNSSTAPEFRVNSFTTNWQRDSQTAVDAAGDFVVAWKSLNQDGSSYGVYAQRYNAAGIAQGGEFQVNTYATGAQYQVSVAMDAAGDFVVAWMGDQSTCDIYARLYNAAGVAQGGEFRVNSYTTGYQLYPKVAMDAAGEFVVTWQSTGQDGSSTGIFAQRYNASGAVQGGEFQVNNTTANGQQLPAIAIDGAGDFVIAWSSPDGSSYGVYARRYNSAGVAQGNEFPVNTFTTSWQSSPTVAMDTAGDFVVTWSSYRENLHGVIDPYDGSYRLAGDYGIYARRYNAAGVAQGAEFQVSTYTTGDQRNSTVAMDGAGDFVVSWTSYGQDGSNSGVYAQYYNAAGAPVGGEFQINEYTANTQFEAAVGIDSAGNFVVSWSSFAQDGNGYGIFAQRFENPSSDGDDLLTGGAGNDTLYGEGGADSLWGGEGNDSLAGGQGNDALDGEGGNDTLNGGAGTDTGINGETLQFIP